MNYLTGRLRVGQARHQHDCVSLPWRVSRRTHASRENFRAYISASCLGLSWQERLQPDA